MAYVPYPIYDFKSGLNLYKEPWMLPADAFTAFNNAYIQRGVIKKRKGYSLFGRMIYGVSTETLGTGDGTTLTFNGTLANIDIETGSLSISYTIASTAYTATDDGAGNIAGTDVTGTIDYTAGTWSLTFTTAPDNATAITADYNYYPNTPILGIYEYMNSAGSSQLQIYDAKRVSVYDEVNKKFVPLGTSDIFATKDGNFYFAINWYDKMWVVNNTDGLYYTTGTSDMTKVTVDTDGDGVNDLDSALWVLPFRERLLLFSTYENGNAYHQRIRWSKPGNGLDWTNDEYLDLPTDDWIVSVDYLRDYIIIWCERTIWKLYYTGDAVLPFGAKKLVDTEGSYATYSLATFETEQLAFGPIDLVSFNGTNVTSVTFGKMPELVLSLNQKNVNLVYSVALDEVQQNWWAYPSIDSDYSNKQLVLCYKENSLSIYDIAMQSFGYWVTTGENLTWDDISKTWDEMDMTWDGKTLQAGYPITLGGDRNGNIWHLNDTESDNGAAISMELTSGRWNPFIKEGYQARLGWIDFYFTRDDGSSIDIEFYHNENSTTPYMTKTITLAGDYSNDKVLKRVFVNNTANFHQISIKQNAANQSVDIHAIIPYFQQAGRIKY